MKGHPITFPDIKYSNDYLPLCDNTNGLSTSVKTMRAIVEDEAHCGEIFEYGREFSSDDEIEADIINRINKYVSTPVCERDLFDLQMIFHRIEVWGGSAGRMLYLKETIDNWDNMWMKYPKLVDVCLSASPEPEKSIDAVFDAVKECNEIKYFGVAFITKHTRFWLVPRMGQDALPIFDSLMASNIMSMKYGANLSRLKEYWHAMIRKSKEEHVHLVPLERQLFKRFFDENESRKANSRKKQCV